MMSVNISVGWDLELKCALSSPYGSYSTSGSKSIGFYIKDLFCLTGYEWNNGEEGFIEREANCTKGNDEISAYWKEFPVDLFCRRIINSYSFTIQARPFKKFDFALYKYLDIDIFDFRD